MATKVFTKSAQFVQSAWTKGWEFIDGIYVDESFFTKNIPILSASLALSVKPTRHFRQRSIFFTARTFEHGVTGSIMRFHLWLPLEDHEWEELVNFGSAFYGAGLNPLYWVCEVDMPTDAEVIYTVEYELEVKY